MVPVSTSLGHLCQTDSRCKPMPIYSSLCQLISTGTTPCQSTNSSQLALACANPCQPVPTYQWMPTSILAHANSCQFDEAHAAPHPSLLLVPLSGSLVPSIFCQSDQPMPACPSLSVYPGSYQSVLTHGSISNLWHSIPISYQFMPCHLLLVDARQFQLMLAHC